MKSLLVAVVVLFATISYAKPHKKKSHDGSETMRMTYANIWKRSILAMFADAGETNVKLAGTALVITNKNCGASEVKEALRETFGARDVAQKMAEIKMVIRCDTISTALAKR